MRITEHWFLVDLSRTSDVTYSVVLLYSEAPSCLGGGGSSGSTFGTQGVPVAGRTLSTFFFSFFLNLPFDQKDGRCPNTHFGCCPLSTWSLVAHSLGL
jgi:hypothetical protein